MTISGYAALFLGLAALITYINHRFVRMQATIAIMASALLLSLFLLLISKLGLFVDHQQIAAFVNQAHFHELVINVMLGLLLFAGALTIDLTHLKEQKVEVMILTVISTIASAFLVAFLIYGILDLLGLHLKFVYCMLFGSLISPTDPIAVLAIFKQLGTPKRLETMVSAESLFNDGVGVVLFVTTYKLAFMGVPATFPHVVGLFMREAAGGVLYGLLFGWLLHWLLRPINDSKVAILFTFGGVFAGYTLAQSMGLSGPLAMVTAGIFLANYKRKELMSNVAREKLNSAWEIVEELLNTVLFLVLGFELLVVRLHWSEVWGLFLIVPAVLLVRYVTVALPISILKPWRKHTPYTISILTWGGLRGGLAVALALAIPDTAIKDVILAFTYAVVTFSILVQGTTITHFARLATRYSERKAGL